MFKLIFTWFWKKTKLMCKSHPTNERFSISRETIRHWTRQKVWDDVKTRLRLTFEQEFHKLSVCKCQEKVGKVMLDCWFILSTNSDCVFSSEDIWCNFQYYQYFIAKYLSQKRYSGSCKPWHPKANQSLIDVDIMFHHSYRINDIDKIIGNTWSALFKLCLLGRWTKRWLNVGVKWL